MPIWRYPDPLPFFFFFFFFFFAPEQPNMCTSSWFTSDTAEAVLFSRYSSLKVGWVIQHGTVVYFDTSFCL